MNRSKVLGKVYHQVISTQVQTKKEPQIQVVHQSAQEGQEDSKSSQQKTEENDIVDPSQSASSVDSTTATTKQNMTTPVTKGQSNFVSISTV